MKSHVFKMLVESNFAFEIHNVLKLSYKFKNNSEVNKQNKVLVKLHLFLLYKIVINAYIKIPVTKRSLDFCFSAWMHSKMYCNQHPIYW